MPLCGKPLVYHTLKQACDSKLFDKVILSTDITVLLEEEGTPWVRHKRLENLAENDTHMIRVVRDVLYRFSVLSESWVWLLQPTSPFRTQDDFKKIDSLLQKAEFKSFISVSEVDDHHALRQYLIDPDQEIKRLIRKPSLDAFIPRQKLKPTVERNGLFYALQAKTLREVEQFDPHPSYGFLIPVERSRNINSQYDYELAQFEAERLRAKGLWS